jgi:hypothetical protein
MECLCLITCQARRDDGSVTYVKRGEVRTFLKCPEYFTPVDSIGSVDFTTAGEEELMAASWTFDEAHEAILAAFNIELVKEDGTKKSEVVTQILDAKFRYTDKASLTPVS